MNLSPRPKSALIFCGGGMCEVRSWKAMLLGLEK